MKTFFLTSALALLMLLLFGCSGKETVSEDIAPAATEPALAASTASAQGCPKGLVDDPYPGSCGQYTDADGNQICDYGQS